MEYLTVQTIQTGPVAAPHANAVHTTNVKVTRSKGSMG